MNRKNTVMLKGVKKLYMMGDAEIAALCGIDLYIRKNEFVSITGPSGSGKSTLLHIIGALDRPTHGKVMIDGRDVSGMNDNQLAEIRCRKIGFVFQSFNLIPRMSALENVMLPMWFAGFESREEKARKLLEEVGLGDRINNKPTQMSGGQQQRVAIARSLANDPEIIIADEPTGNLDSKTGTEIIKMLRDVNDKGATLILVTHEMKIAGLADRQIHIKDGKIIKGR